VRNRLATALFVLFTIILVGWTYAKYELFRFSDCHMDQTGELAGLCRAYLSYQPQIIFWRSLAVEALAIVAYVLALKRKPSVEESE